ncbi:MAG TPA: hypothetical protein VNN73_01170 [Blastocatellia bacterium]|nr:hypothetical protein [Blastocatellia bacterium]
MSAKITILFFILICLEIGLLLVILPWLQVPSWSENYFLMLAADKLHWLWFANAMKSGYVRGAVTGLGLVNIMIGVWEIVNFKKTVAAFQVQLERELNPRKTEAASLSDNRPVQPAAGEQREARRID